MNLLGVGLGIRRGGGTDAAEAKVGRKGSHGPIIPLRWGLAKALMLKMNNGS